MTNDPNDPTLGAPAVEPSAILREAAGEAREWFVALVGAGFTEAQACRVIGAQIAGYGGSGEQ